MRTTTRESADFRRQSLIDATAASLAELGVAGTSVRAICARAGVSPGLLTHYFDGIDDLVAATYRDVTDRVSATLRAAPTPVMTPQPIRHDRSKGMSLGTTIACCAGSTQYSAKAPRNIR